MEYKQTTSYSPRVEQKLPAIIGWYNASTFLLRTARSSVAPKPESNWQSMSNSTQTKPDPRLEGRQFIKDEYQKRLL